MKAFSQLHFAKNENRIICLQMAKCDKFHAIYPLVKLKMTSIYLFTIFISLHILVWSIAFVNSSSDRKQRKTPSPSNRSSFKGWHFKNKNFYRSKYWPHGKKTRINAGTRILFKMMLKCHCIWGFKALFGHT